jgi:hypothetical protein
MSTVVNTKKSGRIQNTVAVAIVGFGIIVSSFGFAQASEPNPVSTTPASVTTTVHVTSTTAVGGVLGK